MSSTNRQFVLAARPVGLPKESDFNLIETPIPTPQENQFVAQALYLSVDPYMRGRMNDVKSYAPAVQTRRSDGRWSRQQSRRIEASRLPSRRYCVRQFRLAGIRALGRQRRAQSGCESGSDFDGARRTGNARA